MGPTSGGSAAAARIGGSPRGQMSVIGLVIIVGITIVGMTTILAFGTSSITESQASTEVERAGQAMSKMDSKISFTALGASDQQTVHLPRGQSSSTLSLEEDAGWMNISIRNATDNSVRLRVLNETMGALVYENQRQDVTIAYQGGGVWRKEDSGTSMVSPPEFHYQTEGGDPTLTLPLVVIQGDGTIDGNVQVSKDGSTITKYPDPIDPDKSNPLTEGEVNLTIKSQYYEAWGAYFEDRTDGSVTYDHERDIAMISLVIPNDDDQQRVTNAIASTKAGDQMKLSGSGNAPSFVDSYNSSKGDYQSSKSDNGTIELAGDIELTGNSELHGDIRSGGHVTIKNGAEMDGWVYWTTGFSPPNPCPCDGDTAISGVESADSKTSKVLEKLDDLNSSNDNDYADDITGDTLDPGSVELNASENGGAKRSYYHDGDLTIGSGDKLTFDTSDGNVTFGIDGSLTVKDGGNITVAGNNRSEIWVGGSTILVGKDGTVHVPNDTSRKMWVYGTGDANIDIDGSQANPANFTGVLYAPSGPGESGTVLVQHANVWGALVVGSIDVKAYGDVHYDEALTDEKAFATGSNSGTNIPQITYLHISVNKVNVSDT